MTSPDAPLPPATPAHGLQQLPLVSLPMLILWSFATLGFYMWWWMYSRSAQLNRILPPPIAIPQQLIQLCLSGFAVTFVLALIAGMQDQQDTLRQVTDVLSFAVQLLAIYWIVLLRRGLQWLMDQQTEGSKPLNIFLTLLFSAFYLQYRINRAHESARDQTGLM